MLIRECVVGFIQDLWVYPGTAWGSSVSFGFVGFIRARSWGRLVHCSSLSLFGRILGVVCSSGRRVHSGAPLVSLVSFGFIPARPACRPVHLVSLCSIGRALVVVVFIRACPACRWVHSGSFVSFMRGLCVVRFIGFVVFNRACSCGPCVHSGVHYVSLGSFEPALGVVRFILVRHWGRWFHLGAHYLSSVSLEFVGFVRARPWCRQMHLA